MKKEEKKKHSNETIKLLQKYQKFKHEFHTKWGDQKRLDRLVGVDFRVKFMKAEQMFKESVLSNVDTTTVKMIDMMYRAYDALEEEMQNLGYKPLEPHIRCFNWDGQVWYVTDMDFEIPRAMQLYKKEGDIKFISVQELLRTVPKELMDIRLDIAMMFEGSKFVRIDRKVDDANDNKKEEKKVATEINEKSYIYQVEDNLHNFIKISLTQEELHKVYEFAEQCIDAKKNENHHKKDPKSTKKRFITGYGGELAVEKYLGKQFINWTVGNSSHYTGSDLSSLGVNLGVKTATYGKFALVPKRNKSSEIIVIKSSNDKDFYLCGIADKEILNKYQDDSMVFDVNAKKRKSAFYGYRNLKPMKDLKKWIIENV
jgi:hypothetical protein